MSRLQRVSSVVRTDPVLAFRILKVRLLPPAHAPRAAVRRQVHGVWFHFDPASDPTTADKIAGRYEIHVVRALERHLRPGGTFLDVGANIGYVSAIGAGLVGPSGQVHSFEPVPRYFERLQSLAAANPDHRITVNQCAVGDQPGSATINVSNTDNVGWNTMVPGYMAAGSIRETVEVPVVTLSDYIEQNRLSRIDLIKIDTEGFEFPVLRGLKGFFDRFTERPAIICEVAPGAYSLMGSTLGELDAFMRANGYRATCPYGRTRSLAVGSLTETSDVLFVPA